MKKHIVAAIVASIALVIFSYVGLLILINVFPNLANEYFDETFRPGSNNAVLYYLHPIILSFMLAWFWDRFKGEFRGSAIVRGVEMGIVYGLIAIVPSMLLNYSAFNVSFTLILTWLAYGVTQGIIAGIIFGLIDP